MRKERMTDPQPSRKGSNPPYVGEAILNRIKKKPSITKAAAKHREMMSFMLVLLGLLVVAVDPLCAYHRGKPFVEVLALIH
jgi:uncharacterized membrane protein (DUF4010 family)